MRDRFDHFLAKWPLPCLILVCCASCSSGDKLNTVQGQVLYKDQPLKGVLVTFHPKGVSDVTIHRPVGLTKEDGTFTLTTGEIEGAPAGEYVVTMICPEEVTPKEKPKGFTLIAPETEDRFKGAYADLATSKITAKVTEGVNQLEPFRLK
jgi:hypothetical protein